MPTSCLIPSVVRPSPLALILNIFVRSSSAFSTSIPLVLPMIQVSRMSLDEKFHADLIANYFQEYEQYLQTLGQMSLYIDYITVSEILSHNLSW